MAIKTYSEPPHNDDFNTNSVQFTGAEEKNYLRILFRPGRSVQVRELNQMQSMLQSQIDKFGQSVYKEGPILGGQGNLDNNGKFIDVTLNLTGESLSQLKANLYQVVSIKDSDGMKASLLHYEELEGDNKYRFFIRYNSSRQIANDLNVQEYSQLDTLSLDNSIIAPNGEDTLISKGTDFATVDEIGAASVVKTDSGVYFINGEFIYNATETLYIAKPALDYALNGKLVFIVTDSVVTYVTDPTLLDNAAETPNYTAPGADRYKIDFKLAFLSDDNSSNGAELLTKNATGVYDINSAGDFITLFDADMGIIAKPARTEYTQLDRKFADRTFEESGNYCLKPFKLDLREYLNDEEGNRGRFTESDITDLDAIGKIDLDGQTEAIYGERHYVAGLEPSIAYVQGYRVDLQNKKDIQVEKARETHTFTNVSTSLNLGNYVVGTIANANGVDELPDFADQTVQYSIDGVTGTCRVRSLEKISDSVFHLYIYDVNITSGYLNEATSISTNTFKFIPLATFELIDSNDNSLLFPLPYNTVESVTLGDIKYKRVFSFSGDTGTLPAPTGYEFYTEATSAYIGIEADGTTINLSAEATVTSSGGEVALTFANGTSVVSVLAPVKKTTPARGAKTRKSISTTETPNVAFTSGATIDLSVHDIFDIVSVTYLTDPNDSNSITNITDQFTLDNGQRDNYYQNGKITYTGSIDLNTNELTIVYRYFEWTTPGDFFDVQSYGDDEEVGINVEYNEIPIYSGFPLSDVLDFRPIRHTNDNRSSLDPDSIITLSSLSVYLPRYDKIVVSTIGDFSVVKGTPSVSPVVPATPADSMSLYELFVPAYTFDASEITTKYIDNRRYTMKDIGTIERRVKNLEYYTSLSLLEQEATEKKIFTGDTERFKNGILVDSFIGHNIGNPFDANYTCAIDQDAGVLRPTYSTDNVLFGVEETTVPPTTYRTQETVSLPYDEVPLITQSYASISESVNPFDLASWLGVLKLDPSMDEWKETAQRPDVIVNSTGAADAIQFLANQTNVLGTKWNEWETNWIGVDIQKTNSVIGRSDIRGGADALTRSLRDAAKLALSGTSNWRPLRVTTTTSTTTTNESRRGIRTTMNFRDQQENLGDRVVDISFVPFIRSRRIELHGEMFKPNTRMYVFFDGIDISAYCSLITSASTPYLTKAASVQTHLNEDAATILSNRGITRGELITDEGGNINVQCFIPNNAALRFKTGERTVTLTDSPKNSIAEATTYSFATYNASGLIETKESTILSTRIPEFDQQRLSNNRTLTDTDRDVSVRYYDPLAQSFVIGEINTGTSVTKVDLFFQKKHPSIPVTAHLVTVENGIPTQNIVPFSKVVKNPTIDTINVTDDASVATTFTFDAPVYLQPGVEYAIVVMSNSPEYRLWLAETGGDDVTGQGRIDKNPYAGVSFKSQNASTWTPDQNRDFKFTLYRAKYETNDLTVTFNGLGTGGLESISNFNVLSSNIVLPKNNISWSIKFSSVSNAKSYSIDVNTTEYAEEAIAIANVEDIELTAILSTTSDYIAPIIDLSRLSLLGIRNIINSPTTLENTTSGSIKNGDGFSYLVDSSSADVQYITRTVTLNDPADRLNIYLLANRPTIGSNIHVLVKLKTDETTDYDVAEWYEIKPLKRIPVNSDGSYSEAEFEIDTSELGTADIYKDDKFLGFAVKVVLTSSNIIDVPTVQDFRAIATT